MTTKSTSQKVKATKVESKKVKASNLKVEEAKAKTPNQDRIAFNQIGEKEVQGS